MQDPFLGQITVYPYSFAPLGWAECAGQLLSISQFSSLYSLLGTSFGGDGIRTFGLPDLRGRVPLGVGQLTGGNDYAAGYQQLMRFQFQAQTATYRANFPNARCDIIELDGSPVGRIVVDRPGDMVHIVDQAIVQRLRNRGFGTAIMKALMQEARGTGLPVRLKVASTNGASMRLYLRLGFVPIHSDPLHIEMEWPAPAAADCSG